MSEADIDVVRGLMVGPDADIVQLFRDDAVAAALATAAAPLLHPEFEAAIAQLTLEWRPGFAGLRAVWLDWLEPWETYRTEAEELLDLGGGQVLYLGRDYARRPGSEVETPLLASALWTVVDGQVRRILFFASRAEALEATGVNR